MLCGSVLCCVSSCAYVWLGACGVVAPRVVVCWCVLLCGTVHACAWLGSRVLCRAVSCCGACIVV